VYKELNNRSVKRGTIAISIALILTLILYLLASMFGFLTFYKEYEGSLTDFPDEILNGKYEDGNTVITVATFAVCGTLLFSAPLNIFPCRNSFYTFFWPG